MPFNTLSLINKFYLPSKGITSGQITNAHANTEGKHESDLVLLSFFQMNIIAGGFYDGLMLYTHALNETMSMSGGRPPGKVVTKRMWNRTFHG